MSTESFMTDHLAKLANDPDRITIRAEHDHAMRAPIEGNHHLIAWTGTQHNSAMAMLRNADTGRPSIETTLRRHGYVVENPRGTRNCIVWLQSGETPREFLETLLRVAHKRIPYGNILPFEHNTAQSETDHYPPGLPRV